MQKRYLGDGVYAEIENDMLKLTTEEGLDGLRDTIYLEPEVLTALLAFNADAYEERNRQLAVATETSK